MSSYIKFAEGSKEIAGVYIDGSNLYHGAKAEGWQIDYQKMKDFIERRYKVSVISYYDSIGYARDDAGRYQKDGNGRYIDDPQALKFFRMLKGLGLRLVTKKLKFINGDESKASNKMDGDLMVGALSEKDTWDVLILMSGDCDFESLVKVVALEKKVHIFSFKENMSWELKQLAFDSPNVTYTILGEIKDCIKRD